MRHCRPSIRRALLHIEDHIRGCAGGAKYADRGMEDIQRTVKVQPSSPYSLPNERSVSLL